jgi:hypothetical protein
VSGNRPTRVNLESPWPLVWSCGTAVKPICVCVCVWELRPILTTKRVSLRVKDKVALGWVSKFTPKVFQDNPGWPFSPHLKWIAKYQTVAWIPPRFPPAGQRQITSTNTCFIRHCPNQSEHHATLPNIILNYPSVFKIGVLRQEFYAGCPSRHHNGAK